MASTRRKRLTREEQKALTRSRLLDAAARVIARRGFAGASIEEIAEDAGYTRGAFYSSFADKDELLYALLTRDGAERLVALEEIEARHDTVDERLRAIARWQAERGEEVHLLTLEFLAEAARNPRFGETFAQYIHTTREVVADRIEVGARERGLELPLDAKHLATAWIAFGFGFSHQQLLDPDEVPSELLPSLLSLFFSGEPGAGWKP